LACKTLFAVVPGSLLCAHGVGVAQTSAATRTATFVCYLRQPLHGDGGGVHNPLALAAVNSEQGEDLTQVAGQIAQVSQAGGCSVERGALLQALCVLRAEMCMRSFIVSVPASRDAQGPSYRLH